jgi:hypothetical protein
MLLATLPASLRSSEGAVLTPVPAPGPAGPCQLRVLSESRGCAGNGAGAEAAAVAEVAAPELGRGRRGLACEGGEAGRWAAAAPARATVTGTAAGDRYSSRGWGP